MEQGCLEILVEDKVTLVSSGSSPRLRLLSARRRLVDTGLCVVADPLLEEVCLPLERDHVHEIERVHHVVDLFVPERHEQAIGDEFNVLIHQDGIHADQRAREGVCQKLLFDRDGLHDDKLDGVGVGPFAEVAEEETGKVGVHPLVAGDELVGKGEAGHQAALLEPKDGGEGTGEEDALDGGECDEPFTECGTAVGDPFQCPVGLSLDAGDVLDGVEEVVALDGVFDVRVDEEGVRLRVDVFPGNTSGQWGAGRGVANSERTS